MILKTERLVLRPIEKRDADDIYEYAKNPNVGPDAGWKPHKNKRETMKAMEEWFLGQPGVFGITLKGEDKVIGSVGLAKDDKRQFEKVKMLGYSLGEEYWGRGYATEAARAVLGFGFEQMRLELISAYCYPFNKASRNVLEKCGMKYEGLMRFSEKIYNGNIYDTFCFSLKRAEYYNRKLFNR